MDKAKILIVEDDGMVALMIKGALEQKGYSVVGTLGSGEEVLENIGLLKPDLVLMDINLQGELDGVETTQKLLEQYNIPVVYLTGDSEEMTIAKALQTEPYGYVLKPFRLQDLFITIQMALQKSNADQNKKEQIDELQQKLFSLQTPNGTLAICNACKRVRGDNGDWQNIDVYIKEHSALEISEDICPACFKMGLQHISVLARQLHGTFRVTLPDGAEMRVSFKDKADEDVIRIRSCPETD